MRDLRFQASAISALQEAAEAYLVGIFEREYGLEVLNPGQLTPLQKQIWQQFTLSM